MTVTEVRTLPGGEPYGWINDSGLDDDAVLGSVREVAQQLTSWVRETRKTTTGSLFDRNAYQAPDNPYDQMRIARNAVANDDIVGGAADVTEGLIFQGVKWESAEPDEADVFNQMARDLNLDAYLREAYRELFTNSQVVTATWWGYREYKVRGRNIELPKLEKIVDAGGAERFQEPRDPETNRPVRVTRKPKRRRVFRLYCPTRLTILDSLKVVPVGNRLFGEDRLAWHATREEIAAWEAGVEVGLSRDAMMSALFIGRYRPDRGEAEKLAEWGVDPKSLLEFNPSMVWRHTLTKPAYAEFPDIRLKSVFKHLDLKSKLMDADRVNLIGAANYILLVKKGTKEDPAYPEEITNLKDNFDVVAKLPVIISDHRLSIEIITPKVDLVLQNEKYDTLDRRILQRLIGALTMGTSGQRNESTLTVARGVARILESRRQMLKRELEAKLARAVVNHPLNASAAAQGKGFEDEPNLAFTPNRVQLDNDSTLIQAIMSTRNSKDLSRETWLEFLGFDQSIEAQRREMEEVEFDPIFQTAIPFNSPANNAPPQVTGGQGGRPPGGGSSPGSPEGTVKPRTDSGAPSTGST